jgi:hypothetical protein
MRLRDVVQQSLLDHADKLDFLTTLLRCDASQVAHHPRFKTVLGQVGQLFQQWLEETASLDGKQHAGVSVAQLHKKAGVPASWV